MGVEATAAATTAVPCCDVDACIEKDALKSISSGHFPFSFFWTRSCTVFPPLIAMLTHALVWLLVGSD
jgi:hypothetical protein